MEITFKAYNLKCCVGNYILRGQNCEKILHNLPVMPPSPLTPHAFVEISCRSFFLIPLRVFCSSLRLFQQDSISCVWTPVTGSTKCRACTTTRCVATLFMRRAMPLYAAQSSLLTSVPGRIHFEIMGSSVAMSRLSTTWKYPRAGLNSVVTIPNTQASLALLPRLYLAL